MPPRVGVVLAGGAGRRFGGPKGAARLGSETLAERAAAKLVPLCSTVVVSVAPGAVNPAPLRRAIEDAPPAGRGPLAGLEAAYRATAGSDLLVLACDYPWVETPLLQRIASWEDSTADVILVVDETGCEHPLVALWRHGAGAAVGRATAAGAYAVHALLRTLLVRRLGPAELIGIDLARQLVNVNRREEGEGID